ncbi:MAG: hypothetical protein N4A45_06425 [Flavobacteriales bacterium]|jgi:hypothetical protein|nr:hypothetical protein [Flavobacteriales bacterium]
MRFIVSVLIILCLGIGFGNAQPIHPKKKMISVGITGNYMHFRDPAIFTTKKQVLGGVLLKVIGTSNIDLYGAGAKTEAHISSSFSALGEFAMYKGYKNTGATEWIAGTINNQGIVTFEQVFASMSEISAGIKYSPSFLRFRTQYSTSQVENYKFRLYLPIKLSRKQISTDIYYEYTNTIGARVLEQKSFESSGWAYSFLSFGGEYYLKDWLKIQLEVNNEFGALAQRRFTLGLFVNI